MWLGATGWKSKQMPDITFFERVMSGIYFWIVRFFND